MRASLHSPLQAGGYYHVFNSSNNQERLFRSEANYWYFLRKYQELVAPFVRTYAYCLLANHFHLLVAVRELDELRTYLSGLPDFAQSKTQRNWLALPAEQQTAHSLVTHQFSRWFNAYSKAINKQYQRRGNLFHRPFKRLPVDHPDYRRYLVYYIHANPIRHGWLQNVEDYYRSSYHTMLTVEPTFLEREVVLSWYGGRQGFLVYHQQPPPWQHDSELFGE